MKGHCEVEYRSVNVMKRVSAFLIGGALILCSTAANRAAAQGPAVLAPIDLGSASTFAVLAGSTVTNTGLSNINGDLGVWPGTAYVPGTPSATVNGTIHAGDVVADRKRASLATTYKHVADPSSSPITVAGDYEGQTPPAGPPQSS